jgi:putative tryptophan/tyrosine transport system substrate-binding protein
VIERRTFMAMVSRGLLVAPLAAQAQQAGKVWRIGIVTTSLPAALSAGVEPPNRITAGLLHGLRDLGYVYGRDFVTEPRSAEGRIERIRPLPLS